MEINKLMTANQAAFVTVTAFSGAGHFPEPGSIYSENGFE